MAKRRKPTPQLRDKDKVPWYEHRLTLSLKMSWIIVSTVVGVVVGGILKGPEILESLRKLPADFRETLGQYKSWVYEDEAWTGNWSGHPQYIVNVPDMNLSNTDLEMTIWATEGVIDGTIVTTLVCKTVPFDFLLLKGEVRGNEAQVVVYDFIFGKETSFAFLVLSRGDDGVITVTTRDDQLGLFPVSSVRVGSETPPDGSKPEPTNELCSSVRRSHGNPR
jgi:hypothetical protein